MNDLPVDMAEESMKRAVVSSAVPTPMGTCRTEASLVKEGHRTQQQRAPFGVSS